MLNPSALAAGQTLQLPPQSQALTFVAAHEGDTPLSLAVTRNLPLWDVLRLNPQPLYTGKAVRLPGTAEREAACMIAPLVALSLSPQPVDRGHTALFVLETAGQRPVSHLPRPDGAVLSVG